MKINVLFVLIVFSALSSVAFAQIPAAPRKGDTTFLSKVGEIVSSNIKFSGELGSQGELYSVSGRTAQKPGQTGRIYFRPTLSLFDKMSFSLDLFLSTEGKGSNFNKNIPRPDLNTFGLSPEWSWGKVYFGDFTMQLSQYTLTDAKISGYGVDLFPGVFKFMAYAGKSQKAISADALNSQYERTIYGGKIGLGELNGDHLHFNFLRAYDNPKSLNRSIFRKVDSSAVAGGGMKYDTSYTGISPQENLIFGVNWSLGLFSNKFRTKNEVAVSLYTADLYSSVLDNKDIPKDFGKYYTPRTTTSGDFALQSENTLALGNFNFKGGYTLLGPGYTSLGMGSLMNDRQIISGGVGMALFSGKMILQTSLQKQTDNVAKQRTFTTNRDNYTVMISTRLSEKLSVTLLTNSNKMLNNATNDTVKLNVSALGYSVTTNYSISAFKAEHSLDVGYNVQNFDAKNVIRGDNKVVSASTNIGINTTYNEQLSSSIIATINGVETAVAGLSSKANSTSLTGALNYKLMKGKLTSTLSYSSLSSDGSTSGILLFRASYQIFEQSTVSLQSRATTFKGKGPTAFKYSEYITNLDWSYRF